MVTHTDCSTIRQIQEGFVSSGRTNKLLTQQAKTLLLQSRPKKIEESAPPIVSMEIMPAPGPKRRMPPRRKKTNMDASTDQVDPVASGIMSQKTSCQSLNYSNIPELPENKEIVPQGNIANNTVAKNSAQEVLFGSTSKEPKRCGLNLFVNYNKMSIIKETGEQEADSLHVFKGDPTKNYPFKAPSQILNEANFESVNNEVEQVDFNFYDEYLVGKEPLLSENLDIEDNTYLYYKHLLKEVQMQEEDAFKLYNQVFSQKKPKITLEVPMQLRQNDDV